MDTIKIKDRLKLYELALADYEASLGKDFEYKRVKSTMSGFCAYFLYEKRINVYVVMDLVLPELYAQKPTSAVCNWFIHGDIQPRIDCLKKAIELTKQKCMG